MKLLKILFTSILFIAILSNCEDPVPNDYVATILFEGLLIVDQPIEQIRLTRTLSLNEPYYYGNALIKDANIFIYDGEKEIKLSFREFDSANIKKSGYYYADTSYKVKPNTEYRLKAVLNYVEITGNTTTPNRFDWVRKIVSVIPYPDDTIKLPAYPDAQAEWTTDPINLSPYILSITCLDTLEYGKYLNPPTADTNRRIKIRNRTDEENPRPAEVSTYFASLTHKLVLNWNFCRWFGKNNLKIYLPDKNYAQWFMYYLMSGNFNDKSYSVEGAAGYFGSASMIESEFFLQKNKYAK